MNVISIAKNKALCCGCSACAIVCPKHAIHMVEDEVGQLYPMVDNDKCVNCSLCSKACCQSNPVLQMLPQKTIAASYKNQGISAKSSSGGIFAALAEVVLNENGVVYGTRLTDDFKAEVVGIDELSDLYLLQGSKYVKSTMEKAFVEIKENLDIGRQVLFSGVPCQVAAIKSYLGKRYENLVTVDIVCHGSPSNRMFLDYLNYIQKKKNKQIVEFHFRDKAVGQDHRGKVVYRHNLFGKDIYKKQRLRAFQSSYYKLFLNCMTFRESCYDCRFAAPERVGDISLGDYWGIDEIHPEFARAVKNKGLCGISAVMINTNTGKRLYDQISNLIIQMDTDYSSIRRFNPQLNHPSPCTQEHKEIMDLYAMNGYGAIDKYYFSKYRMKIITQIIGQPIPVKLKKRILEIKRKVLR